jgi:hypothetical protein
MSTIISRFFADPAVKGVVLFYLNHGSHNSLDLPRPPHILPENFCVFCEETFYTKKPLLVILDCCFSTQFAENVLASLTKPVRVGFLTSGRGDCQASATVVSRDPALVYHCPPQATRERSDEPSDDPVDASSDEWPTDWADDWPDHPATRPPVPATPPDELAPPAPPTSQPEPVDMDTPPEESEPPGDALVYGYRVQHSMFSRALLPFPTYRLSRHDKTTLSQLPRLMNHPTHPLRFGFEAAFLPEAPEDPAKARLWVGNIPIRFFFPWAPIRLEERSVEPPHEQFCHLIPSDEVGDLYDDVPNFWQKDHDETFFDLAFVEIELTQTDPGTTTIVPVRQGFLDSERADEQLIIRHTEPSTRSRTPAEDAPHSVGPRVRLGAISHRFREKALARNLASNTGPVDPRWLNRFKAFLRKINGHDIAICDMKAILRMANFGVLMKNQEEFEQMVQDARDEVLEQNPSW